MDGDNVQAALRQCKLFRSLRNDELLILKEHGILRQLAIGDILYKKGEKSNLCQY